MQQNKTYWFCIYFDLSDNNIAFVTYRSTTFISDFSFPNLILNSVPVRWLLFWKSRRSIFIQFGVKTMTNKIHMFILHFQSSLIKYPEFNKYKFNFASIHSPRSLTWYIHNSLRYIQWFRQIYSLFDTDLQQCQNTIKIN